MWYTRLVHVYSSVATGVPIDILYVHVHVTLVHYCQLRLLFDKIDVGISYVHVHVNYNKIVCVC